VQSNTSDNNDGWDSNTTSYISLDPIVSNHKSQKPIVWPILIQFSIIVLSIAIYFFSPVDQYILFSLIGYFLTPFLVVLFLGLQRSSDTKNRSNNWFDIALSRKYFMAISNRISNGASTLCTLKKIRYFQSVYYQFF
jgi:hypothetical protein